jgi:surface antigen
VLTRLAPGGPGTAALQRGRWRALAAVVALALVATMSAAGVLVAPTRADAGTMPGGGSPGVTALCVSSDYSCAGGGYSGSEPWGYYTAYGNRDAAGRLHNCTSYAAFRLAQNGAAKPNWWGNADQWDERAAAAGARVDGIPAVGAIAQWNGPAGSAGHVAYVEGVDADGIVTTDDNYSSMVTTRYRIARTSPSWPDNFVHIADVVAYPDGSFVQATDNNEVYRIVGGAPVYVSTWTPFGGEQPLTRVSRSQLDLLPRYPADGTFVAAGAYIYRFAGGAPIYVSNWAPFGGVQASTVIDPAAIDHADGPSPWNHIRRYPADGTTIATSAYVFVVAGGAPVYVSNWAAIGGARPATVIDQAAVDTADGAGPWSHLRRFPTDGTFVRGIAGDVYRFAGGAPLYVSSWSVYGGVQATTLVDGAALVNGDGAAPWDHVHLVPADGTFLQEPTGKVYRVAGGAALWVSTWAPWGGVQPTIFIDPAAVANAGATGAWSHLARLPRDGTVLQTVPSGAYWRMSGGTLTSTTAAPAVLVNDESIQPLTDLAGTSYATTYTDAEHARLLQVSAFTGQAPQDLPRWTVTVFAFLLAISNPRPAPTTVAAPSMTGTAAYTTSWTGAQLPVLRAFQAQYGLGPEQAQKFAVNLYSFLLALSGH